MTNAAERKSIRAAEKEAKLADIQRLDYVRQIMSTSQGRQWAWGLLSTCGIFTNPMSSDDRFTAFACGAMNIGQQFLADIIVAAPDAYIQAMREANERGSATAERERSADADGGTEGSDANSGGDPEARRVPRYEDFLDADGLVVRR